MKKNQSSRRFFLLLLPALLLCAVAALGWHLREKEPEVAAQAKMLDSTGSAAGSSAPTGSEAGNPRLRLALSLLASSRQAEATEEVAEKEARADRMERERFFAEERQIMAKTWNLTDDQAADFDIAANEGRTERQAVFARMTGDSLSPAEVSAQLAAANERTNKRLLDALGPEHFLEYRLTVGHFVEAGMDKTPFVPPTWEPGNQPEGDEPRSQASRTVGLPPKKARSTSL